MISLANDTNCIGGVFEIESGGGEFYAVKPLSDAMKYFKSKKPLIVLGGDFLCSAAYYLAIYADEVWSNHPKAIIGSIGTMISFADVRPYFEKQGVVFHEIYATASSLKNKTTSEAYKGNYKPIIDKMLDPVNNDFIDDVKALRGKALNSNKAILQGETFFGTVALSLGMVDAQGDLKGAVSRVRELAAKPKQSISTQQSNMKYPKLTALLTALEGGATATQEELDVVNAELAEGGITAIGIFPESLTTEAAQATVDLATQTAEVTRLTTELTEVKGSVTSLTAENITLKEKVAKGPAAAAPVVGKTDPLTEETAEQKGAKIISSLPHNQGLLNNPLFQKN
jgi:protease-4